MKVAGDMPVKTRELGPINFSSSEALPERCGQENPMPPVVYSGFGFLRLQRLGPGSPAAKVRCGDVQGSANFLRVAAKGEVLPGSRQDLRLPGFSSCCQGLRPL